MHYCAQVMVRVSDVEVEVEVRGVVRQDEKRRKD
jgi:hypothetical protein